jgi:arabinofuranosyltransferase
VTGHDLLIDEQLDPVVELDPIPTTAAGDPVSGDPFPAEAGGEPDGGRTHWGLLQFGVLAVPVVVLAVLAWTHRSMFLDGYIYLHVVQNVLAGNGPVFNAGQRVEVFTSPLWMFILSVVCFVSPLSLTSTAVDLGILFTVAGVGLAVASSARLVRRAKPDTFLLPLGAIVFVAVSPVWSLASLGLETGLMFFWLGSCLAILVTWAGADRRDVPWWGVVVLGLGPLVRPELGLDTLVFVGVLLFVDSSHRSRRRQVGLVAWAFALPVAYELFRMGYYGMLVANTAVAKEASLPRPAEGLTYFLAFVTPYWLVVPAAALLVGAFLPLSEAMRSRSGATRNRVVLLALPIAAVLNAGYITIMGGDYIHARLLIGPFFAACAPVATVPMARRFVVSLLVVPWALLCSFTFRTNDGSPWSDSVFVVASGHGNIGAELHSWGTPASTKGWLASSGTYLQMDPRAAPTRLQGPPAPGLATPTVATYWIGAGPFQLGTGVRILDLLGLNDPLDAHMKLTVRGKFPGHEKPMPTPWIVALMTAPGTSPNQIAKLELHRPGAYTPLIPDASGQDLAVQTSWARAALDCPTIHALEFGPDRPLTVSSFFDNLFHSVSETTLRIPPNPETAYHRFCGPGTPAGVRAAEA